MFFFSSCQKEELTTVSNQSEIPIETTTRNVALCDECPNLIENGDFSDVCSPIGQAPFIDGCVGGKWVNAHGTMNIINNAMEGIIAYTVIDSTFKFTNPEAAFSLMDFNNDIDYCLCFSSMYRGDHSSSDINDWKICVYATDGLTAGGVGDQDIPSNYTDPSFNTNFEEIYCYDLTTADDGVWINHSIPDFSVSQSYTQFWPVMLPKDNFDLTTETSNRNNHYYFDDINLTCESEELQNISWNQVNAQCLIQFTSILVDPSAQGITYFWDFGDGSALATEINLANPSHQYTPGTYDVTLTITDINGCCKIEEMTVFCGVTMDHCKYICHQEFINHIKCANRFLFNDQFGNPKFGNFSQPIEQTDFTTMCQEMQTYFDLNGYNMIVSPTDPTGNIICYKWLCVGCPYEVTETDVFGNVTTTIITNVPIGSEIELNQGVPTGVILQTTGSNGSTTPNGPPGTVTPNPNGPGYIINFGVTEGIFAMGDAELINIKGSEFWNYLPLSDPNTCTGYTALNGEVPASLFLNCP